MIGVPRQIKGPKPWPLHPWMVSFYDGKWRCQAGVLRDEDYVPADNERTFEYSVQNVRQNMIQYQRGNMGNDKGGSNNPKTFILSEPCWTGGNKVYQKAGNSNNGIGVPASLAQSVEIDNDGQAKWASGVFSATQPTYIVLRKVKF